MQNGAALVTSGTSGCGFRSPAHRPEVPAPAFILSLAWAAERWPQDTTDAQQRGRGTPPPGGISPPCLMWLLLRARLARRLALTHDVETARGRDTIGDVQTLELHCGYRSSWNLVPERYTVP